MTGSPPGPSLVRTKAAGQPMRSPERSGWVSRTWLAEVACQRAAGFLIASDASVVFQILGVP